MNPEPLPWFERTKAGLWVCTLCPHACVMREGDVGKCRVRAVRNDQPTDLSYGKLATTQVDPIEKKPLFHFMPGTNVFSIGGYGCNFRCAFCQNWHIAGCRPPATRTWQPEEVVTEARKQTCIGIAYTYNEPIISYPFLSTCARLARKAGLYNILVTNGYIQEQPASALLHHIDAINLDIKSMSNAFYREHCGGQLQPVLAFARQANEAGVHLEITHLLIPGLNDSLDETEHLATWIATNLTRETPLHITAYYPAHEMHIQRTAPEAILAACATARKHLAYVYSGNIVDTHGGQNTDCHHCRQQLVRRQGWQVQCDGLTTDGRCIHCGRRSTILHPCVSNAP